MANDREYLKINEAKNVYGANRIKCSGHIPLHSVIYAPNGIFKTSFARALNDISNDKASEIEDRITHDHGTLNIQVIDAGGKEVDLAGLLA